MNHEERQAWLAGLKAKDEVVVVSSRRSRSIFTVQKITATQVVIHNTLRFRRKDGREIGKDSFHACDIEPVTQNDRDCAEAQRLRSRIVRFLEVKPITAGDLDMLKRMEAAITAPPPPTQLRQRFG